MSTKTALRLLPGVISYQIFDKQYIRRIQVSATNYARQFEYRS